MKKTTKTISITEAARNFADCLNRVHYQNVTFVLIKNGTDRIVYVRDEEGHYVARSVRTGMSRDGRVVILEGVTAGENVVVHGALLLDGESEQLL